jgi:hypothetical protein
MPYWLASTPQMFIAVMQHVRAVENAIAMHAGVVGGGAAHMPFIVVPHTPIAISKQHGAGGFIDKPGFGGGGIHVFVPHGMFIAAVPVPAAPEVPAAAPVPAVVAPRPAAVAPAVTAPLPLAAAEVPAVPVPAVVWPAGVEGSSPPQAMTQKPNTNANQETRAFILEYPTSTRRCARIGPCENA